MARHIPLRSLIVPLLLIVLAGCAHRTNQPSSTGTQLPVQVQTPGPDYSEPKTPVLVWIKACRDNDFDLAASCWSTQTVPWGFQMIPVRDYCTQLAPVISQMTIKDVTLDGNKGVVECEARLADRTEAVGYAIGSINGEWRLTGVAWTR